jgi:predicted TIM-barrel fold metal-dependent hydrolase
MHPRHMRSGPRYFSVRPDDIVEDEVGHWAQHYFNWQFETTLAMGRLVYSGMLDKYPNLKIVTHHCGGFVPYQANRISAILERNEMRSGLKPSRYFRKRPVDYYKMLYGDTACYGNTSALMCGFAFFGADHILFGTDMPWDSQDGQRLIRDTIQSVKEMDISKGDKKKIFEDNARNLFRLPI